ncbi:MAG: acyl-CoA dehydrogenase family protein [Alphaproteobacteria bacterium]
MDDARLPRTPLEYPSETRGLNFFEWDRYLRSLLARVAPDTLRAHRERLSDFGAWAAGALDEQAAYTDRYAPPRLDTHDREGRSVGRVVHNPAYMACHAEAYRRGVIGLAFGDGAAPHLLSFVMGYLLSHADISIHCPVTMTGAVAHVLERLAPQAVRDAYLTELTRMDGGALSAGTWATELHGGSDVGATTTTARRDGDAWRLRGLKWFTSNAGSGLALATARPEGAPAGGGGLGCYLVPDRLPDGAANSFSVRRLKDKLGTRGLATGEVDLDDAWALEVAGPPQGLKVMLEALEYSRVHNAASACGLQHRAFLEAVCWATHREAFGGPIRGYPMVRDTLLDMQADLEAGTALTIEAARAFDDALRDDGARVWLRVATALAKHRTGEQVIRATREAVELVGGNGYTEEWATARLYRDAMVLPVWEGPSNIQALELLRVAVGKVSGDQAFLDRVGGIIAGLPEGLAAEKDLLARGRERCREAFAYLRGSPGDGPRHGRRLLDLAADVLSAALMLEHAAHDLAAGDQRGVILARRFTHGLFGNPAAIGPDPDPAHAHFDAIVGYAAVPV